MREANEGLRHEAYAGKAHAHACYWRRRMRHALTAIRKNSSARAVSVQGLKDSTRLDSLLRDNVAEMNRDSSSSMLPDCPDSLLRVHTYGDPEWVPVVMPREAAVAASAILLRERRTKTPKLWWTRQLFAVGHAFGLDLLDTLKLEDEFGFRNFTRMTPRDLECLL